MSDSIWSTVECDAWSRDFDYENYLGLYNKITGDDSKISKNTYSLICQAFDNQFKEDQVLYDVLDDDDFLDIPHKPA